MAQDTSDVDNILLYKITSLHEVYHKIEPQLQHLKQITTLGTDVSDRLQAYFTIKETNMVSLYKFSYVSEFVELLCYIVHQIYVWYRNVN